MSFTWTTYPTPVPDFQSARPSESGISQLIRDTWARTSLYPSYSDAYGLQTTPTGWPNPETGASVVRVPMRPPHASRGAWQTGLKVIPTRRGPRAVESGQLPDCETECMEIAWFEGCDEACNAPVTPTGKPNPKYNKAKAEADEEAAAVYDTFMADVYGVGSGSPHSAPYAAPGDPGYDPPGKTTQAPVESAPAPSHKIGPSDPGQFVGGAPRGSIRPGQPAPPAPASAMFGASRPLIDWPSGTTVAVGAAVLIAGLGGWWWWSNRR